MAKGIVDLVIKLARRIGEPLDFAAIELQFTSDAPKDRRDCILSRSIIS